MIHKREGEGAVVGDKAEVRKEGKKRGGSHGW